MTEDKKKRILKTIIRIVIILAAALIISMISRQKDSAPDQNASGQQQAAQASSQEDASDSNDSDDLTTAHDTSLESADEGEQKEALYTFRNRYLRDEHFKKHGKEFDYATAQDYEAGASAVVNNDQALHKTEADDGDDVYYLEKTNEFVVVSADGYIRTYFKPNDGMKYYNRQ